MLDISICVGDYDNVLKNYVIISYGNKKLETDFSTVKQLGNIIDKVLEMWMPKIVDIIIIDDDVDEINEKISTSGNKYNKH